jgi:2-keto-3-deoxy-L-fuconate dehydrogenase
MAMSDQTMVGRLSGKRLLITGAAAGIGAATARRAVAEGARVALVDINEQVREVAAEVGGLAFVEDVCDPQAPARVVAAVAGQLGGLDGLANIAGGGAAGDVVETTDETWERTITLNLTAPFRWSRAAAPAIERAGGGAIVNISSIAGTHALPKSVSYVSAKHGLIGLTRSIAVDYGPRGVRCNAICPGTIQTPLLERYLTNNPPMAEGLKNLNFVGRFGTGDDVAALCVFLLSDDSGFVNGESIAIDGGRAGASVGARI